MGWGEKSRVPLADPTWLQRDMAHAKAQYSPAPHTLSYIHKKVGSPIQAFVQIGPLPSTIIVGCLFNALWGSYAWVGSITRWVSLGDFGHVKTENKGLRLMRRVIVCHVGVMDGQEGVLSLLVSLCVLHNNTIAIVAAMDRGRWHLRVDQYMSRRQTYNNYSTEW